jgi:hypothetical protein
MPTPSAISIELKHVCDHRRLTRAKEVLLRPDGTHNKRLIEDSDSAFFLGTEYRQGQGQWGRLGECGIEVESW